VHRYADIVAASQDVSESSSSRDVSFEELTDKDTATHRSAERPAPRRWCRSWPG
jgi:hypothetical protein